MITSLGKFLRKLRIDRDMKTFDFAEKTDMSVAFVSAIETGKRPASKDFLSAVVRVFNLAPEQVEELHRYADETKKEVRLSLIGASSQSRQLASAFARRFEEIDTNDMESIMKILQK